MVAEYWDEAFNIRIARTTEFLTRNCSATAASGAAHLVGRSAAWLRAQWVGERDNPDGFPFTVENGLVDHAA